MKNKIGNVLFLHSANNAVHHLESQRKSCTHKTIVVDSLNRINRDIINIYYFRSLINQHNSNLIVLNGGEQFGK
ncbi:hypothetical protein GLW08_19635 [Pontibacillus yanchengensis]|uniref:Uncharacterized protein n=2 Tax=Pontibacillus yanchengensis TaxID=462910 RepID=A0ACC7VLC8_9BACI|nr:hypothetical protein [Pontibacillus yanchengensis]MYL35539.1 hypothetical protein [Pontibacillus yanchengensis]MYL55520.1 hypothetical protein [Pontibacillus yanchengensis]